MDGHELPVGWQTAEVGNVCRLVNGRAYSKPELLESGKYRVLRVGNLFTNPHWYYSDLELEDDKYCQRGDLLYAWSASFGPHVWDGERVIYHYHIWKVDHDEDLIDRDYLRAFFQWDTNRIKQQRGSGSTMLHVTKKSMEQRNIPVPSTSEQRRIAARLDTTLAAVEACRQRLDGVAAILKRFRQAVLAAATSGELTREWREERGMEKDWLGTCLSDIADIQGGLTKDSKKQDPEDPELPYLRVANVQRGYLDLREMAFIRVPRTRFDALLLQDGDILLTKVVTETKSEGVGSGKVKSLNVFCRITSSERACSTKAISPNLFHGGPIHVGPLIF
jgi:type I restriction enzyme S subunit